MISVRDAIVRYLDMANLMQLATFQGDRPWCATVYFAADNLHNLYWLSPPHTQHSRDIERNTRVAGAITLPHAYGQPPQGLQFTGTARLVPNQEIETLFQAFAERFNAHHRLQQMLSGQDEGRLYQVTPQSFILYDEEHFAAEPRQEWRPNAVQDSGQASQDSTDTPPETPAPYDPMAN